MSANPPDLRPDRAPAPRLDSFVRPGQPRVGMVSLGCPKALVDSERILTRLRAEGYAISPDYAGADAVIVNTCGFLDSAKAESLEAIGEALCENGRVIVTGCLGADEHYIRGAHPTVLAVTGPQQYEAVVDAVHAAVPPSPNPYVDLLPASSVQLTPRHYSYLKISEGCNHKCRFCVIPDMRGKLVSRPAHAVLREAERLVAAGVRELLVISQDTSAYGTDRRHDAHDWRGKPVRSHITDLARELGSLGSWVRLHYVYPYPHVRELIPLMAEGRILPYLDIPFQHSHPDVLRRMARPAASTRTLEEIARWREDCPELVLRSTFIVGFPGETETEFEHLLDWLDVAQLDRVGCFRYENVTGARSNLLPDHVPEAVKEERWNRFMERAQAISAAKLAARVGSRVEAIVDEVDPTRAVGRTRGDAPEIDGRIYIDEGFEGLSPGQIVSVEVRESDEYDLRGVCGPAAVPAGIASTLR
ncbi:MAG: 30S ribosomal protein S12 methylthiotransferase RimO [Amaricoccus sp.]